MSERVFIYTNPEDSYSSLERKYDIEIPYLEQTKSWRNGMLYKYSPDFFELNPKQLQRMNDAGEIVGKFLNIPEFLEFRIDFVESEKGILYITEVQTDDRGLPAIAIARNARGVDVNGNFQGIYQPLLNSICKRTGKENPIILISYPKEELFYYNGFYDLARILNGYGNVEILVTPRENIKPDEERMIRAQMPEGFELQFQPDLVWNFSNDPIDVCENIQPKVTKQILFDLYKDEACRKKKLVPMVRLPSRTMVDRNRWVIKPIDGRWSKGVVFGYRTIQEEWENVVSQNDLVAQRFIEPRKRNFYVRQRQNNYSFESFYTRVEGYYIKNFDTNNWELADVLATGTKSLPVHGKRDCIMIPAVVNSVD